ncbi:MAG: LysR family transcriptional regulator [Paenibacillaceae bacterium]|nr:LysR family transcriptional regulator [Paenibacillaceae bacterium]
MNISKLEYFLSVAKYKNFTKAAQSCHIAQPAISQQIISLEEQLGFLLIDRKAKEFCLTDAGKVFYQDTQKIINEFYSTVEKCKSISCNYYGNLTIGIVGWDENVYLNRLLYIFKKYYPNINIHFKRVSLNTVEEDLKNREYDCTITVPYDFRNKKGIGELHLVQYKVHALISMQNPLSQKNSVTREDLASECNIVFEPTGMEKNKTHLLSFYTSEGYIPKEIKSVSDRQILDILIGMNEGVAIVPEICKANSELGIIDVPICGPPHCVDLSIIFNSKIENDKLSYFLDIAKREQNNV